MNKKLSGAAEGAKRGAILRKIVALERENSRATAVEPPEDSVHPRPSAESSMNYPYYACWTAVSFHGLGPTGRVKVQYSLNSIGSELLPEITAPLFASTV